MTDDPIRVSPEDAAAAMLKLRVGCALLATDAGPVAVVCPRPANLERPDLGPFPPGTRLDSCISCLLPVVVTPNVKMYALSHPVVCTHCIGDLMKDRAARRPYGLVKEHERCVCEACIARYSMMAGRPITAAELQLEWAAAGRHVDRAQRKRLREELRRERRAEKRNK